jgi:hypothetical protein
VLDKSADKHVKLIGVPMRWRAATSTESSRATSRPTFRCGRRPNTSWARTGIRKISVNVLSDLRQDLALRPCTRAVVKVVDAGRHCDPAPLGGFLILHRKPDVVRDWRNVGLNFNGLVVEQLDVGHDVQGRPPLHAHARHRSGLDRFHHRVRVQQQLCPVRRRRINHWKPGSKRFQRTKNGAIYHWTLEDCLDSADCPLDDIIKKNPRFLIGSGTKLEPCPSLLNDGTFMQRGRDGEQDGSTVF